MSGHHSTRAKSVEWSTPPEILSALGSFDDDVCSGDQVWNGLCREWHGRVWCNPPYGPAVGRWLSRMAEHRNGTALVFARTETRWFQEHIWLAGADAVLFIAGRLHFYRNGIRAEANAGAPSCLIAYSKKDAVALRESGIPGALVTAWTWATRQAGAAAGIPRESGETRQG